MKTHTQGFKNQIKELGREIDSKITYGNTIISAEELFSVSPILYGDILKSVMKQLDFESSIKVPVNTIINYKFGLKVDGEYEYIDYGNYIVYSSEYNEDTKTYKHTCYDKLLFTMKEYKSLENGTFPMTVRDYITNVCLDCGLLFIDTLKEFANYDKTIESDLYANLGYTYRDVLDELAQVTASTICLNKHDSVEIRYITETNDTIDSEYLKDVNVKFGEKYGPINSIVLSRSAESDNVYKQDEESVAENGLCELKIIDNQIMNDNNRSDFLPDILEKLNGLEYYINDFTSTGILYYDLCDRYTIQTEENTYSCVLFNDEPKITQGIVEDIYTERPIQSETDYDKADKTDRRISKVFMIVDKQEKEINATVEKVGAHGTAITNLQIRDGEIQTNIDDANGNIAQLKATVEGLENNVTTVGGGNLIKDSLGSLNDGSWSDNVTTIRDTYTLGNSIAGQGIMLNANTIEQKIQLPNEVHTLSFKYKKLLSTINAKLYVNDVVFNLDQIETTEFIHQINVVNNSVTIKFECDTNNGCYILDLMLNLGTSKDAWTQNANETSTDTVKIGKGIQVEDSKYGTYWRADADGTRIINKVTGDIVQQATDKGTETNEFTSRSTSIVNGVLFTRVGDQVWESVV